MKKRYFILILIIIVGFIVILFNYNTKHKLHIITDPSSYSPLFSSVPGIHMSVSNIKNNGNYDFYWYASEGFFLDSNKQESNTETVTWIALPLSETSSKTITISLVIKNKNDNSEVAKTYVTLISDNNVYKRKK